LQFSVAQDKSGKTNQCFRVTVFQDDATVIAAAGERFEWFRLLLRKCHLPIQTYPGGVVVDERMVGEIVTITNNEFFTGIVNFKIE